MFTGHSPARSSTDHTDAGEPRFDLDALADRAEEKLRDHLREEYGREPTEEEVEWVRGFPRRMAGGQHPQDPRTPTLTEIREEFEWGPSESEKKRWGKDFAEQQASGPNLSYR
jgi:hypothetical protein